MTETPPFNELVADHMLEAEVVVAHRLGYWWAITTEPTATEIEEADEFLERYVQYRISQELDKL